MDIVLTKRNIPKKLLLVGLGAAFFAAAWFSFGKLGFAYHPQNPSIDDGLEHWALSQCPASNTGPGQTLGVLYFSPATITSAGGNGSTGIHATAVMCTNSNYNRVSNIHIFTTGRVNRTSGSGNVSLSQNFYPPNIPTNAYEQFAGPVSGSASFSNLSAGWNCWDVEYDMSARYGSGVSNIVGTGWMNLCVYYSPPPPPNHPYTVQGYRTYGPGQGTAFPSGVGSTTICGANYTNNFYARYNIPGPCAISSASIINWGGRVYDRVGNTMCYDRTDCHNAPRDGLATRNVNLAGPTPGRYVDIWWHYAERDQPPTITLTPVCATPSAAGYVRVQIFDPNGGTSTFGYTIDSGGESWRTSNNYNIPMGNWNDAFQYDPHNVTVRTRGVAPAGSTLGGYVTRTVRYGVSATRGCRDRGFIATPTASDPVLLDSSGNPDEENPSQVQFNSGVSVVITPGSSAGVRLTTTRSYFIRRGASIIPIAPGPSPSPDTRLFNGNYSYPTQTLSMPSVQVGDQVCVSLTVSPGAGLVDSAGNVIPPPTDPSNSIEECVLILNKPYFQVFNGDISAGDSFESAGCPASTGRIRGFTRASGSNIAGAGTQLSVSSRGRVEEFMSASMRSITAPVPPKGLTIANNGTSGSDPDSTYGGGTGEQHCIPNYWANAPDLVAPYPNLGSSFSFNSTGNGRFRAPTGTATMGASNFGGKRVVYIDGDLRITGNVTYSATSWSSLSSIPSLVVIVRGNIHISPSVSNLEGIFISLPNGGSGGHIYTCSNGSAPSESFVSNTCDDNRLTVSGQLIGQTIHLFRTINSLRDAAPRDAAAVSDAAELFIESPEVWLSVPEAEIIENGEYENVSNVPPVL